MAYTDFAGKIILHSWGRFRMVATEAVSAGDIVTKDGYKADADNNRPAWCIACEDIAANATGFFAKKVEIRKVPTIATGGGVTAGDHSGPAGDVLWLSATGGDASETPVANIGQVVGRVLSTDRILLEPAEDYDPLIELVAAAKPLDALDIGKQMYSTLVGTTGATITLPAVATGAKFVIVSGMQNADGPVTIDPANADAIGGADHTLTTGNDGLALVNTKTSARCGDRAELEYGTADGWYVTKLVGTWALATS